MRLRIRTKLIASFMVIVLLMIVLAFYVVVVSRKTLQESVGKSSIFLADETMTRIDQSIYLRLEDLQRQTKDLLLQKTVLGSNAASESLSDVNNDLSIDLRETFIQFYERKYGIRIFAEILVTDEYGATIAQTGSSTDYKQDDKEWWQAARASGFSVSDVAYDERTGIHGIVMGIRIDDEEGNFIGVMKAVVASDDIIREAETATTEYETTAVRLMTTDGRVIYGTKAYAFLEDVSGEEFFEQIEGSSGYFVAKGRGRERLFSYARSKGYKSYAGFGWILVVGHDTREVLRPALVLTNRIVTASIISILFGVLAAFFISRSISKPVVEVRNAAEELARGNLDKRVAVTSSDEIGELADSFNEMAGKLSESYTGLEEKVRERTEELEKANLQLQVQIIERKKAAAEIRKLNEELEQRVSQRTAELVTVNKELEAFSYSVSHDLRAPLRAIDGFSRMLEEDYVGKIDGEGRRRLKVIQDSTQDMGKLIDNLLEFSRMGRKELKTWRIDMDCLAREVGEELRLSIPERKVELKIKQLPPAFGDRAMIREVFANLMSNAFKFTRPRDKALVEILGWVEGKEATYSVTDNGVGFDMRYREKLFQVFQRLHGATEFPGTGIGLALVQRIIQRHGGRVWAESKLDKGTTFYFTLANEKEKVDG